MKKANLKARKKIKAQKPKKVKNSIASRRAREKAQIIASDFIKRIEEI